MGAHGDLTGTVGQGLATLEQIAQEAEQVIRRGADTGILDRHSLSPIRLVKYNSPPWLSQIRSIAAARFSGRDRRSKAGGYGFVGMIGDLLSGRTGRV